jgi:hypothetical protein
VLHFALAGFSGRRGAPGARCPPVRCPVLDRACSHRRPPRPAARSPRSSRLHCPLARGDGRARQGACPRQSQRPCSACPRSTGRQQRSGSCSSASSVTVCVWLPVLLIVALPPAACTRRWSSAARGLSTPAAAALTGLPARREAAARAPHPRPRRRPLAPEGLTAHRRPGTATCTWRWITRPLPAGRSSGGRVASEPGVVNSQRNSHTRSRRPGPWAEGPCSKRVGSLARSFLVTSIPAKIGPRQRSCTPE